MPRSGISHAPLFEWALAAQWWGYKWEDFQALPGYNQAFCVAVYRGRNQMEAVIAKEQADELKVKK